MKDLLNRLIAHDVLSREETCTLMLRLTEGTTPDVQIAALLTALQMRGITVDELLGFRDALMQTRVAVDLSEFRPVDIVGTGGDGKNTFNISTCACAVVAGAGYNVAKHGNYGATSVSGASNVIEQHGVKFTNDADVLRRSMEETHFVYMHAQLFNPGMKCVGPTRKQLGFRTVFNLLGPLVNPAQPAFQLLGVANLEQMRLYTNVLQRLGIGFCVVTSLDGYDEISLTGDFKIQTSDYEKIFAPEDLGLRRTAPELLRGGTTPQEAVALFDRVLDGTAEAGQTDVVVANAAFAINTVCPQKSIDDCLAEARESLASGRAKRNFQRFIDINS